MELIKCERKSDLIKIKKHNARLYPIYKMFSWDLLFYYSISFVFLTQTKGVSTAAVMFTDALYPIYKMILQIPCSMLIERLGKRKSIMVANAGLSLTLICLMLGNGITWICIANLFLAFAFAIKGVAETNLLYDSVTTHKGKGLFAKLEELGSSRYYYLDGITSVFTGFLFIINGYIPMMVSLMFTIVSIAISSCFKDIYLPTKQDNISFLQHLQNYQKEISTASKFIFQSKRLKAFMLFSIFFDGMIYISYTLREGLLTQINIPPQYFALIIAGLTFIAGIGTSFQDKIHKKLRNKALSFISLFYSFSFIGIGLLVLLNILPIIMIPLLLGFYILHYLLQAPYITLKARYLKSFATPNMRIKIESTFSFIRSISEFTTSFVASFILALTTASNAFLIAGLFFTLILFFVLHYMKPRFGLKPEQYSKKDIEYAEIP